MHRKPSSKKKPLPNINAGNGFIFKSLNDNSLESMVGLTF